MSKPAKPAAAPGDAPPKKSKKMLIIIVAAVLLIGGGAAAYVMMKPHDEAVAEEVHAKKKPTAPPKYVELGTFTSNLIHEDGDRYLQVAISLKITEPELEEQLKASNPEILHRINMLLQTKSPSELSTLRGKEDLAEEIKQQVEYVMGFRKVEPRYSKPAPVTHQAAPAESTSDVHGDPHAAANASSAPVVTEPAQEEPAPRKTHQQEDGEENSGIAEVLFTSFIIQ